MSTQIDGVGAEGRIEVIAPQLTALPAKPYWLQEGLGQEASIQSAVVATGKEKQVCKSLNPLYWNKSTNSELQLHCWTLVRFSHGKWFHVSHQGSSTSAF